jgi:NAD-dependent DNA ligase
MFAPWLHLALFKLKFLVSLWAVQMSDINDISKELNILKDAQKLAKDTAKIVTDIQSDNNEAVKQAQKKREIEKKSKERMLLNAELQAFLENSGAKITNSVSKNTDLLIVKDEETIESATGKVEKALELGIDIITKDKIKY